MGGEIVDRALSVGTGLVLLFLGNTLPKVLSPLTAERCAPAQVHSVQRVAGWAFVLAGIVTVAAALVLPVDRAQDWTMIATLMAVLVVAVRFAWAFRAAPTRSPSSGS